MGWKDGQWVPDSNWGQNAGAFQASNLFQPSQPVQSNFAPAAFDMSKFVQNLQIGQPAQTPMKLSAQDLAGLKNFGTSVNNQQFNSLEQLYGPQNGSPQISGRIAAVGPTPEGPVGSFTMTNTPPPTNGVRGPVNAALTSAPPETAISSPQMMDANGNFIPDAAGGGGAAGPNNNAGWANFGLNAVMGAGQLGLGFASLFKGFEVADFQKKMAEKNYSAQVAAYNNALEDKISGRHAYYGAASEKAVQAEIERKKQKDD